MYRLEKYSGSSSRHICPSCGHARSFVAYVNESGSRLPLTVGRCNRESKCGYHYKPKEFFADSAASGGITGNSAQSNCRDGSDKVRLNSPSHANGNAYRQVSKKAPDSIPNSLFLETLNGYERNPLYIFLCQLFPHDIAAVRETIREYMIGTFENFTVFPRIDRIGRVRTAKLIRYDSCTGKRLKSEFSISSLQARLKREGKLRADFETDRDIFFGDHLLLKYPHSPVAIVESEKTAILASICKRVFPHLIWLASGSKQSLKAHRIRLIGRGRSIILYPDADGYQHWCAVASEASSIGMTVKVSKLVERWATEKEKLEGFDVADYLIREQMRINQINRLARE